MDTNPRERIAALRASVDTLERALVFPGDAHGSATEDVAEQPLMDLIAESNRLLYDLAERRRAGGESAQEVAPLVDEVLPFVVPLRDGMDLEYRVPPHDPDAAPPVWLEVAQGAYSGIYLAIHASDPGRRPFPGTGIVAVNLEYWDGLIQVQLWDQEDGPAGDPHYRIVVDERAAPDTADHIDRRGSIVLARIAMPSEGTESIVETTPSSGGPGA
jgi:hypothetical protein